jgi:hypothetical protein
MIGLAPVTLGADKAYDAEDFINGLRSMNATQHVARNTTVVGDRRTHSAARQLRPQSAHPQADRGSFQLVEDDRRAGEAA